MKVCIYGAGVIGGIVGGAIARAGNDVCLIARGPHLNALQANGLTVVIDGAPRRSKLPASQDPRDFGPQDLVIVATKTPAFAEVVRHIGPLLGPQTLVAFAVNGVFWFYGDGFSPPGGADLRRLDPEGALHAIIGAERALGMVCWGGGEIREPGVVIANKERGRFVVGPALASQAPRVADLVSSLKVADIDLEATDDIRTPMWKKFLGIASNFPICTLTGGTIADTREDPEVFEIVLKLMSEAQAVARAHGFGDLGFDLDKMRASAGRSRHKPSMLQDFERRRPMELETTFGALQDLARQAGVATPVLDIVAPLTMLKAKIAGCA